MTVADPMRMIFSQCESASCKKGNHMQIAGSSAVAEATSLAPLRISVDTHGGPASGGRLIGKDGSPLDLDGFKKTIEFYLTAVFNVMRLSAAAIAKSEPLEEGGRGVIVNTASIAGYEGQIGQLEQYWGPQVPFPKRMGRSGEYAQLAQSIIENDYLNGEVIRLDGALRFPPK